MPSPARTRTDFIAVHCSATPPGMDIGEDEIRGWHLKNGWSDIGYNVVIRRSGQVEIGRPLDARGAHVADFNDRALGVCLVGGTDDKGRPADNFTTAQITALLLTLRFLKAYAPEAVIQGHRDFPKVAKACPSFDVRAFLKTHAPDLL